MIKEVKLYSEDNILKKMIVLYNIAPEAVENVTCESSTNDTLTVTWQAPSKRNGIIVSHNVSYRLLQKAQPEDDISKVYLTNVGNGSTAELRDRIDPDRWYEIVVYARTKIGQGHGSVPLKCQTQIGGILYFRILFYYFHFLYR